MICISLFDYSGISLLPWKEEGYECWLFDSKHPKGLSESKEGFKLHGGDIREWLPLLYSIKDDVVFMSAFPPCTDLSVSGARWWASKREKNPNFQEEAMELVYISRDLGDFYDCAYYIENPIGAVSTLWRKPDYIYSPFEYTFYHSRDNYTKKTCLWCSPWFIMPEKKQDPTLPPPDKKYVWNLGSSARHSTGSLTPIGFSKAVFEANKI